MTEIALSSPDGPLAFFAPDEGEIDAIAVHEARDKLLMPGVVGDVAGSGLGAEHITFRWERQWRILPSNAAMLPSQGTMCVRRVDKWRE